MEYFRDRFITELNNEGDIEVAGQIWTRHQVLETMDSNAERAVFDDWVSEQKLGAKERCRSFLEEYGCLDRFNAMLARHRGGYVLPFVGAGMSVPSGCRPWGQFLLSLMNDAPAQIEQVKALLQDSAYEEAAQLVFEALGDGILAEEISAQLGNHDNRLDGPVRLLPNLFREEVLTTNFDYVLTRAYQTADHSFTREFKGKELREVTQRMANDPHCLLRLHGEADSVDARVLTLAEYQEAYGDNASLKGLLASLVGVRSFLFLGCSLSTDRTFSALREIRDEVGVGAVRHYAFLPFPGEDERNARRIELGQAEIHPIYYPPEGHDPHIEDLLITMMEGGFA